MIGLRPVLAALLAAATLAPPAAGSGLVRLTDRDDLFGWEAVGRVDIGNDGYCTGVLITPDLVLTAAHCMFDRRGAAIAPADVRFRAGLRDGVSVAERRVGRIAAASGYRPGGGMSAANVRSDAALLELRQPIPAAAAAPFALHSAPRAGERVSVVSYGRNRDAAPSWQRECGLLGRAQGLMVFDCDVTFGSSGAPVFTRTGRRARILSLVSGGRFENGNSVIAYGMDLPGLVEQLKRDLRVRPQAPSQGAKFARPETAGTASGAKFARPGGS